MNYRVSLLNQLLTKIMCTFQNCLIFEFYYYLCGCESLYICVCVWVRDRKNKTKFPVYVCTFFPVFPECDATNITGAVGEL